MSKKRNRFWNKYAELLFIISVHLGGNNYSLEMLVLGSGCGLKHKYVELWFFGCGNATLVNPNYILFVLKPLNQSFESTIIGLEFVWMWRICYGGYDFRANKSPWKNWIIVIFRMKCNGLEWAETGVDL